ncbi:MAG: GAF domain-containing protein [Anaerolineales bacterium]|nr:GAF domain-containing protein [Anaerolineales bacterium]
MSNLFHFFQPPVFEDEDKTRRAQLLNALVIAVFVAIPLMVFGNMVASKPFAFVYWACAVGVVVAFYIRGLIHQGKIYLASVLWVCLALGFVTSGMVALGTTRSTNTYIFLINIVVAGFLLDSWTVMWVTVYSILAVFGVGMAQKAGWLFSDPTWPAMTLTDGFNFTALFLGMALFVIVSVKMMNEMFGKVRREVSERRKTEQALRQRDAVLQAATLATQQFLQATDWQEEMEQILGALGQATRASYVAIFENHILEEGTQVTSLRYQWNAPALINKRNSTHARNMPIHIPELKEWEELMKAGEVYGRTRAQLSPLENKIYPPELLSFVQVPIFVETQWWGIMHFEDNLHPEMWTSAEIDAVKIIASTLGSGIQRQLNLEALHRRDAILQAVNFAAQRFLQTEDWRKEIQAVLARLGQASQASHAYIFERHVLPDRTQVLSQRYEWVAEGMKPEINDSEFQNIDVFGLDAEPWYEALARGEVCQGNVTFWGAEERTFYRERGFKSLVEAPIMLDALWWGVIGFDDFFSTRTWSLAEIEAITIAARTLAAAIQRKQNDEALTRRDAILQAATFAAHSFLRTQEWRGVINEVLAQLGQATEASHVFIFENHSTPAGLPAASLRFEWAAPGIPSDQENPLYQAVPLDEDLEWYETMRSGKVYYANLSTLAPAEAEIFAQQGLYSLINVPIFANNEWWGNIGFDDYQQTRDWAPVEIDALQIAASTLGAAIQRQQSDEHLRQREQQHLAELEARVQERTQKLEEALREIENVSYTASHDLRTPVRAINGYANILLHEFSGTLPAAEQTYLQKIVLASQRMGALLDDLIRLIQLNRQEMHHTKIDLSELAARTAAKLHDRYPNHTVDFKLRSGLVAYGDQEMLQVVIDELLENAWKFTVHRADACILFDEIQQDAQRIFYVQDNGIGFDMAYAHKLFRNFEQLHLPGTYEGTGMGLALVQRIIQRHRGLVWAEGVSGEGATIYFTVPD